MENQMNITYHEWLEAGLNAGWCGPAVCITHDGLPTTSTEDEAFDMEDPCVHIIRLYEDIATKKAVEANHSPSVWRQPRG